MSGRWFDEWRVGDHLVHEIRRTVTETDNLLMSALTHNPQPLHLDADAAASSEYGRVMVAESAQSDRLRVRARRAVEAKTLLSGA